jgi:hypothetical protein
MITKVKSLHIVTLREGTATTADSFSTISSSQLIDDNFMAIVKSLESGNSTAAVDEEELLLSGDRGTANISGMTLLWGMTEVSSGNTSTRHSNGELDD